MKKKSTLLVVLLSLVCLACAAIGFTACKSDDKEPDGKPVVKVGETNIGTVDSNGVVCDIEGALVAKEYVLTVKSGDTVCDGATGHPAVLVSIPNVPAYSRGEYGTLTFKYGNGDTLKLSSEQEVKNVKVVMEEKTYPAGDINNSITVTADTDVNYSVGLDYVWYNITVGADGSYQIAFTGNDADSITVVYGDGINGDGDNVMNPLETTIFSFAKDTKYYFGIASDKTGNNGDPVTLSGTFKVKPYTFVTPPPVDKGALTAGTPKTGLDIDSTGISVTVSVTAGKVYTVTATKDGNTCAGVYVFVDAGHNGNGTASFTATAEDAANPMTVKLTAATAVTGVTLTLTEENAPAYPALTLGTATTVTLGDDDCRIYTVTLAAGNYSVTGNIALTGDYGPNIVVGSSLFNGEVDDTLEIADNGTFTVGATKAGTYYVAVYEAGSFTISSAT